VAPRAVQFLVPPPAHRSFGNECSTCHVDAFSLKVPDAACLKCHDGLLSPTQFASLAALTDRSYLYTGSLDEVDEATRFALS